MKYYASKLQQPHCIFESVITEYDAFHFRFKFTDNGALVWKYLNKIYIWDKPKFRCLSVLNVMEVEQASPTIGDVLGACPDPITVTQEPWGIVVSTPDAELYGFSEIEVELDPLTLTVME